MEQNDRSQWGELGRWELEEINQWTKTMGKAWGGTKWGEMGDTSIIMSRKKI